MVITERGPHCRWLVVLLPAQDAGGRGADGATVKLDQQGEPQPDCQLHIAPELGGQIRYDPEGYFTGAPELIIEIARSSRAFDLGAKKADYERAGVQEYVVVELDPDLIHWFIRRDDRFEDLPPGPDGVYRSEVFPGLWLDPEALFAKDRVRLIGVLHQGLATPAHAAFLRGWKKHAMEPRVDMSGFVPGYRVVSLKNSTINEQKNTISKSLNLLDAGHLPSGSYRGV